MASTFDSAVYSQCVRCGLCLPTCPTYVETLVETSSPRGRIALIKAVDEGRINLLSPGFVHQMYECLDCRACEAVCPSGVAYGRLLEPARAAIEDAREGTRPLGERLVRRLAFGTLFRHLWLMRALASFTRFYQRSGLQRFARASGIVRWLGLERIESLAPPISDRFFVPRDQRWRADGERRATVFLHAGCVQSVAFAETDEATVRVLRRAGCDVIAPSGQGCCGALAVHAGDPRTARAMARRNITAFESSGADLYIINAAGCGSALKEYGQLFKDDGEWSERAVAFSGKVRDALEYLDVIGPAGHLGALNAAVAYQDPCHLGHAQRVTAAPRRLLSAIPGLRLLELDDAGLCCGSAGIYNITHPQMSAQLQERKLRRIRELSPDVVATANPGCALQIASGLRARGSSIAVKHVIDLLDESYGRYEAGYSPTRRASSASAASTLG